MNYLAHLCLSGPTPDSVVGNLMGDFVKGRPEDRLAPGLARGVRLHRAIDSYTDSHPVVRRAAARFAPARRRFAGVALDMAFDHFLARDWQAQDPGAFGVARRRAYALLQRRFDELPARFQRVVPGMIADDWWATYADLEGIARALARMGERLSRPNALGATAIDIERAYTALEADFRAFWPDVKAYALTTHAALADGMQAPASAHGDGHERRQHSERGGPL